MADADAADRANTWASRWLPYVLVGVCLPLGLVFVLVGPTSWPALDSLVGGVLLAVAVGSVTHLVVTHGGPGERGPEF